MSEAKPRTDLSGYFKEISRLLQSQVKVLTSIINHSGEMGDNDQLWFSDLLRKYIPKRIGVDTGFVVNYESDQKSKEWFKSTPDHRKEKDPSIGPQSDILLLDVLQNAPLCCELSFRVYPIEMVLGVIEVTRNLNSTKLAIDLEKIRCVRALAGPDKKKYLKTDTMQLCPRSYIVGLKGSISLNEIKNQIAQIEDSLRPNAILILNQVLYIRKPYTLDFFVIKKDVLFQFIAMLRFQIETFPTSSINLGAYLPAVAEMSAKNERIR